VIRKGSKLPPVEKPAESFDRDESLGRNKLQEKRKRRKVCTIKHKPTDKQCFYNHEKPVQKTLTEKFADLKNAREETYA